MSCPLSNKLHCCYFYLFCIEFCSFLVESFTESVPYLSKQRKRMMRLNNRFSPFICFILCRGWTKVSTTIQMFWMCSNVKDCSSRHSDVRRLQWFVFFTSSSAMFPAERFLKQLATFCLFPNRCADICHLIPKHELFYFSCRSNPNFRVSVALLYKYRRCLQLFLATTALLSGNPFLAEHFAAPFNTPPRLYISAVKVESPTSVIDITSIKS